MAGGKSRYMNIKVDAKTGKVVEVVDENGKKAKKIGPKRLDEVYKSKTGFKYVGTVLHAHSSPGCVYYITGGWAYVLCW